MKRTFSILLLLPLVCLAGAQGVMQFLPFMQQPVAAGASGRNWFPTNYPGYPVASWYVAADYTTNTTPILPDRWTNQWHLTNLAANTAWPTGTASGQGGEPMLTFDGTSDYLQCVDFIWATNCEAIIVCKIITFEVNDAIVANTNSSTRLRAWNSSGNNFVWTDGNATVTHTGLDGGITNQYLVFSLIRSNTTSANFQTTINTNGVNVAVGSAASGTGPNNGLNLGTTYSTAFGWANIQFSEAIFLRTNLTSTLRNEWVSELRAIYGF